MSWTVFLIVVVVKWNQPVNLAQDNKDKDTKAILIFTPELGKQNGACTTNKEIVAYILIVYY